MKVFVTGASGFIGGLLTQRLIKEGHQVFDPGETDLRDHENMRQALLTADPDVILHLAARTEVESSFYEQVEFSEINYVGTVNLIEAARELKNLKLFVFASTMETYGWQPASDIIRDGELYKYNELKPFDEETRQHPNAPYAVAKVGCELYLQYAGRAYDLPYTIFRQTNTYGRHDNDFFVVEQFITQMLKNPDKVKFGYELPYRNFIYIQDLIDLYVTVLNNTDKAKGQVFCTGPANAVQIGKLAEMIAKKLDWKGKIEWGKKRHRPGEIYYLNSTHKKAKELLGWEPKVDLSDGLDKTIHIWRGILNA